MGNWQREKRRIGNKDVERERLSSRRKGVMVIEAAETGDRSIWLNFWSEDNNDYIACSRQG